MTAKRFSYKLDEIFDEGNHFAYALSKENAEDIVELLNELHEENNMLKSSNLEYEDIFGRLEEENEKLKKHIEEHSIDERLFDDLYFNQVGGI